MARPTQHAAAADAEILDPAGKHGKKGAKQYRVNREPEVCGACCVLSTAPLLYRFEAKAGAGCDIKLGEGVAKNRHVCRV